MRALHAALVGLLLWSPVSGASDTDVPEQEGPANVELELARGVVVDWTELTLEVVASARRQGTEGTRAIEQLARREVDASMQLGVGRVRVTADQTVKDLLAESDLADAVRARVSRWVVNESRYHRSGKVELVAVLRLQDLLKPYTLAAAAQRSGPGAASDYSGLIVDARGIGTVPAWAPQITDSRGETLYDAGLWEDDAVTVAPVVYVSDPSHPAVERAGETPMRVRADRARGPDLSLTDADAARFRESIADARVLGEGTVVIVVDPT